MAHPYHKYRDGAARAKHILKGDGGSIDNSIDISSGDDQGPYSLGEAMYEKAHEHDLEEVSRGERFADTGMRMPGRLKARNDAYVAKLKGR